MSNDNHNSNNIKADRFAKLSEKILAINVIYNY
jgi:hypothetical protein